MSENRALPTGVLIEPASVDDAPAIKALVAEARLNPTSLDWHHFTVARQADEGVIGCIQVIDSPLSGKREAKSLVVREDYRGRGVADALMDTIAGNETGPVWGTCVEALVPYYLRRGARIPDAAETPSYYRLIRGVAAIIHVLTFKRTPRVAVLVFEPRK